MVTPNRVLPALLTFLWVVTLGCTGAESEQKKSSVKGRMAEKLDRPTALALLREKEYELLNRDRHSWGLHDVAVEETKRATHDTPNAVEDEKEEAWRIDNMRGELAVRNAFVNVGLLKRELDKNILVPGPFVESEPTTRHIYHFSVVAQPGVDFTQPQPRPGCTDSWTAPDSCKGQATFEIAKAAFTSVTGISQQGIEAEVEAQLTYSPTKLYELLLVAEKKMQEELGPGDLSNVFSKFYWSSLHAAQVAGTATRRYQFRRYDDGWRLVR
jgi:hypothetical protein